METSLDGDVVTARGLTMDYGPLRAVDSVDFDIKRGERFGFLGPNGAGKTTVMRIVHCFYPPSSGEAKVFGLDVTRHQSRIKARIGVTPQEDNLDPDLSVMDNLLVYARYFNIPRRVSAPRARELLAFVELQDKAGANIKHLSGGMKRKLVLARSLLNRPELVMLDEPTTGLDPHSRRAIWEYLMRLNAEGATLILTTHYMEEAERLCERVAIMDSGRIVAVDSPSALSAEHGGTLEDVYLKITGRALEV
jgi:lipooligosaccharide transport system ATP-binding protein